MSGEVIIHFDTKELDRLIKDSGENAETIMESLAFDVEREAKQNAPYLTGALKNSIYTKTKHSDGYSRAASEAKSANPKVNTDPLPELQGKVVAEVGPCVDYAIYLELGTRFMAAHPYLLPATEHVAQKLNSGETWRRMFEK